MAFNPQFTLSATAVTAIGTLGTLNYLIARGCGVSVAALDAAIAAGQFGFLEMTQLDLLNRRVGVDRADGFTAV
jgi:hypothetical protein